MLVNRLTKNKMLLAGVALGAMWSGAAAAQETPAAPTAASSAQSDDGLGEIVVTANRRQENQLKVPVSVAVVDGDAFRSIQAGGDDILSISGRVPGVYAETTTGRIFPRFYIRGLGNIDFYLGASQPVSIIQDDIVLEHVVMKSNPVFDNAQIEVLRGPQGTLFGRNTPAGIIKFDSIKPSFDLNGRASASYGSYNTVTFDGGVGGPLIGDKVAFRLSALYQHRDDWVDNIFTGASDDGTVTPKKKAMGGFNERDVRLQVLVKPDDNFSLLLSGHYRDYDGTATLFRRAGLVKGSNQIIDSVKRSEVSYDEGNDNPQAYKTYGGSANLSYDFGGVVLTSISGYEGLNGYSRGSTNGGHRLLPLNGAGLCIDCGESMGQVRGLDQFTEELRLASSGDGAFKWQVGGLYFNSADITDFYQRAFFLNPGTLGANPNNWVRLRDRNHSWGAFGQVSYKVAPKLTFTLGGRLTNDTKETRLIKLPANAAGASTFPVSAARHVRLSDTQPSFDLSALYEASNDVSFYARVATGFRGPTIQGRSAVFGSAFTTANSEKILSGEVGFKTSLLNDTLRFNGSVFAWRMHDIQLNGNDANGNGVLFNADKAVAYGAEFEADWRPVRNLTISAGLSLLHSEIKDKRVFAQVCALNGVVVCTVEDPTITKPLFGAPTVFAQINGEPLPNAPEYNVNLSARYDQPVGNGKVFLAGDFNIQGYTQYVLYRTKEFNSNGNFELGAKLGYAAPGDKWEIAVFARNLTDERNLKGVIENYMAAVFNEPRIVGIQLSGKFR
jgi:iron complex outermembrane receptor protein